MIDTNNPNKSKLFDNDDFVEGINYLKKMSSKYGYYHSVCSCRWIIPVSKWLAYYKCCNIFWYNVVKQNRLKRVALCKTPNDLFHGNNVYLFDWSGTKEGFTFWEDISYKMFNKFGKKTLLNKI